MGNDRLNGPRKPALVVSHERSGTHFLINTLLFNFGYHVTESVPIGPVATVWSVQPVHNRCSVYKSHHQFCFFNPVWNSVLSKFFVFYVVRDPRAVMASCWRYFNTAPENEFPQCPDFTDFLKVCPSDWPFDQAYSVVKSATMLSRWRRHVSDWTNLPRHEDVCVIRFSHLKRDFTNTLIRISSFLGYPPKFPIRQPTLDDYSVAPFRGLVNGWMDFIKMRDNIKILRGIGDLNRFCSNP